MWGLHLYFFDRNGNMIKGSDRHEMLRFLERMTNLKTAYPA